MFSIDETDLYYDRVSRRSPRKSTVGENEIGMQC